MENKLTNGVVFSINSYEFNKMDVNAFFQILSKSRFVLANHKTHYHLWVLNNYEEICIFLFKQLNKYADWVRCDSSSMIKYMLHKTIVHLKEVEYDRLNLISNFDIQELNK